MIWLVMLTWAGLAIVGWGTALYFMGVLVETQARQEARAAQTRIEFSDIDDLMRQL